MLKKISTSLIAFITMFSMMTPAFALAHSSKDGFDDNRTKQTTNSNRGNREDREDREKNHDKSNTKLNEFGVRVLDNNGKHKGEDHGGFIQAMFYTGTVTAVSTDGFTILTKNNQTFTVKTDSAKLIMIPRTVISLSDIKVGDKANVTGTLSGVVITASVVYDLSQNLKPAVAKGEVTAVSGNDLTVQVAGATQSLPVKVDGDTQVVNADKTPATIADVQSGTTVKVIGFWDNILNVFNAIKIKLF